MGQEDPTADPAAPGSEGAGGAGLIVPSGYVPARRPDVLELDLEDGLILYNRDSSLVHHLNPTARIVWFLCDGSADVSELAKEIAEEYGLDPTPVRSQVAGLVAELDAVGLVEDAADARGGPEGEGPLPR
ncbi:MAG: HPr-rel-A system PqqD family peptide chaperone [Actinomycetota bacterium]